MSEHKPIPVSEWRYLPEDLLTHLGDFRKAVEIAVEKSQQEGAQDSVSYWEKQLRCIDRVREATSGHMAHLTEMTPAEAETLVANAEQKHNDQIEYITKLAIGMAMMNMGMTTLEVSGEDLYRLQTEYVVTEKKGTGPGNSLLYTLQHKDSLIAQQRQENGYADGEKDA